MAAFWLSGCTQTPRPADPPATPSATTTQPPPAQAAVLPAPQVVTDLLAKITDPAVPGKDKLSFVEGFVGDDAVVLDRFTQALTDFQMMPLTFAANDLQWSTTIPGDLRASVNILAPEPKGGLFGFPMDFKPVAGGWQLSEQTANLLFGLTAGAQPTITGTGPTALAPAPPAPAAPAIPPAPAAPTPTR